jgi:tRNA G18 (ribose-2'-O)-methylase SpoU
MERIAVDDPDDPQIADFRGLRDHALRRRREGPGGDLAGIFVAEGDVVVERALRAGYPVLSVLIDATRPAPLPPALPPDVPVYAAGPDVVRAITGMGVHRGMMAVMGRLPLPAPERVLDAAHRVVVLEGVVNPTNLGVIARSAAALGVEALLLDPSSVDPLYRRASRVAMGEVFAIPHARLPHFPAGLDLVARSGFTTLALTPDPGAEPIDALTFDPDERVALVLGAEGTGLTDAALARVDRTVRIPMHHGVDSLNVAAAAAIACFVLNRGRD